MSSAFGRLDRRGFVVRLGAASALIGLARAPRASGRTPDPIWQQIWDADQAERGIPAILPGERGDPAVGFVRIDERGDRRAQHRLFSEVVIPEKKRLTYDLCRNLFDNYRLDQTSPEQTTPDEAQELLALLDAITDSAPMRLACAHVEERLGKPCSKEVWQETLYAIWLRPFDMGRNRDLTGFEHVVVGEQNGDEVSGGHFWYRYYLDDLGVLSGEDDIDWVGTRYGRDRRRTQQGIAVPEVATLAYRWHAHDQATGAGISLFQEIGGFWVGCSIEGLMALGTVRFFAQDPVEAVINGTRYQIDLYRSPDGQSLRTTYPRFLGPA